MVFIGKRQEIKGNDGTRRVTAGNGGKRREATGHGGTQILGKYNATHLSSKRSRVLEGKLNNLYGFYWGIAEYKKSLHLKLHHELLVQNE